MSLTHQTHRVTCRCHLRGGHVAIHCDLPRRCRRYFEVLSDATRGLDTQSKLITGRTEGADRMGLAMLASERQRREREEGGRRTRADGRGSADQCGRSCRGAVLALPLFLSLCPRPSCSLSGAYIARGCALHPSPHPFFDFVSKTHQTLCPMHPPPLPKNSRRYLL
jgi:hypothetical protein